MVRQSRRRASEFHCMFVQDHFSAWHGVQRPLLPSAVAYVVDLQIFFPCAQAPFVKALCFKRRRFDCAWGHQAIFVLTRARLHPLGRYAHAR